MLALELIHYISLFTWGSFSSFTLLGLIAQLYKPKKSKHKILNHEFVLISIASNSVKNSFFEVILDTTRKFPNSILTVVVDEGAELIPELLAMDVSNARLLVVPKNAMRNLEAKGRAIHFFIHTQVKENTWYSFIDDDNLILDDSFLYEIPYYQSKGYIACNPVLIARPGKSNFAYIMDAIRYFDDLTIFRFFTGLMASPLVGLHGELLTVYGKTLKQIGFARFSYTEDFRFSTEIVKRNLKVWQSATKVSIKSPNSVKDLLKQRGRWFMGLYRDLPHAPFIMRFLVTWRLLVWVLGIFGSWAFCFTWLFVHTPIYILPGGVYYWLTYLHGVHKSKKYAYFFAIPFLGVVESVSFLTGIKQKGFVVINKN